MGGKSRKNRQTHLRSPLTNLSLNRTGNSRIFAISFLSWQSKKRRTVKIATVRSSTPPVFTRRCYATTSVTKGKCDVIYFLKRKQARRTQCSTGANWSWMSRSNFWSPSETAFYRTITVLVFEQLWRKKRWKRAMGEDLSLFRLSSIIKSNSDPHWKEANACAFAELLKTQDIATSGQWDTRKKPQGSTNVAHASTQDKIGPSGHAALTMQPEISTSRLFYTTKLSSL